MSEKVPDDGGPEEDLKGAGVVIPPPLYPLAAILTGVLLGRLWPVPTPELIVMPWFGSILAGGGLAIILHAALRFRRVETDIRPHKPSSAVCKRRDQRFPGLWEIPLSDETDGDEVPDESGDDSRHVAIVGYLTRDKQSGQVVLDLPNWDRGAIRYVLEGRLVHRLGRQIDSRNKTVTMQDIDENPLNQKRTARDLAGEIAGRHLGLNNSAVIMAKSGARGSMLNLSQMSGCVGQQAVDRET